VVSFSDGSTVHLEADAQARVLSVDARGARVVLDRGRAGAHVVHRPDTRWSVEAGPFEVRVTGTRFSLTWDPDTSTVALDMREGSVVISGCSMQRAPYVAGQSMRAQCVDGTTRFSVIAPQPSAEPAPSSQSVPSAALPAPASPPAPSSSAPSSESRSAPERWQELAANGDFKEAYAAADTAGFDAVCSRASASELLQLSDAALYAGRADRAREVLRNIRARHPGTPQAATAAFRLGRMAFDSQGAYADARYWLQVYLREQPGGGLAREATGRLIEVEHVSGNAASARSLAAQYLKTWPDGPHAPLARSLVGD
jgi:TolA-binding protein